MSTQLIIRNVGAISELRLPAHWKELGAASPSEGEFELPPSSRDFSPGDPSLTLSLFYRGSPVSENSAEALKAVFAQPDHELDKTEWDSIHQVLSRMADEEAFQKRKCFTLNIKGRRVLVVDGEWNRSQNQFYGLMLGIDGSGRVIQEVFLEGPENSFRNYLDEVNSAIRSIDWKGQ